MYTDVSDGKGGKIFVTEQLLQETLTDDVLFENMAKDMELSFNRDLMSAIKSYLDYIDGKPTVDGADWPALNSANFKKFFSACGRQKLSSIFDAGFDLIYPHLKRDLFSRPPGRVIRWDGTFRYAKITMDDPEGDETIKCLIVVWGEHGHALTWAFCDAEKGEVYQNLNMLLKKRCQMLDRAEPLFVPQQNGVVNPYLPIEQQQRLQQRSYVDVVEAAYSDTCCDGKEIVTEHWITSIWPNVHRAPLKDCFHAQKKVTDSCRDTNPLYIPFIKELSRASITFEQNSIDLVYEQLYKKKEKNQLASRQMDVERMMTKQPYREKICNTIPPKTEMAANLRSVFESIVAKDNQLMAEAGDRGEHYQSLIRKEVPGIRRGTVKEFENYIRHVEKGCLEDPFDMNVSIHPSEPFSKQLRIRGTSVGESCNKLINRICTDIRRMSASLAHKKLMLRMARYNLAKDRILSEPLGIKKPRTFDWYVHETIRLAIVEKGYKMPDYEDTIFPVKIPEGYDEPIGTEYGVWMKENRLGAELGVAAELVRQASFDSCMSGPGSASVGSKISLAAGTTIGLSVGASDGTSDGVPNGLPVGASDGTSDAASNGLPVGASDGTSDGASNGLPVGASDGTSDGVPNGLRVGASDGTSDAASNGLPVGALDGATDGASNGLPVGASDGTSDGVPNGLPVGASDSTSDGVPNALPVGDEEGMSDDVLVGLVGGCAEGIADDDEIMPPLPDDDASSDTPIAPIMTASQQQPQSSRKRTKKPDFGQPAAKWSRRLTKLQTANVFKTNNLSCSTPLNEHQRKTFWRIVQGLSQQPAKDRDIVSVIQQTWASTHFSQIPTNGTGLGGTLTKVHINKLLTNTANLITQQQLRTEHADQVIPQTGKFLTREGVEMLSWRDCRPWLIIAGLRIGSTLEKRRQSLLDFFEKQPEGFVLRS
jgi:hypothetical protein